MSPLSLKALLSALVLGAGPAPTLASCTTAPAADLPASTASAPRNALADTTRTPPTVSTVRAGDAVLLDVTFRSDAGVPISASAPLRLTIRGRSIEVPLAAGPARALEDGGAVVDRATYRLRAADYRLLIATPAAEVSVGLDDGAAVRRYPYVSGDLVE